MNINSAGSYIGMVIKINDISCLTKFIFSKNHFFSRRYTKE
jgi:hypothetical protein